MLGRGILSSFMLMSDKGLPVQVCGIHEDGRVQSMWLDRGIGKVAGVTS